MCFNAIEIENEVINLNEREIKIIDMNVDVCLGFVIVRDKIIEFRRKQFRFPYEETFLTIKNNLKKLGNGFFSFRMLRI